MNAHVAAADAAAHTGWPALLDQAEHVLRDLQDAVGDPRAEASWREAALEYHAARSKRASTVPYSPEVLARLRRLTGDDVSLERAWHELNGRPSGAAAATVEALMFALREGGVDEPHVVRLLARLDHAQVREVATRLQKLATAWAPEDVQALFEVWSGSNGKAG